MPLAAQAAMDSAEVTGERASAERAVELFRSLGPSNVLCEALILAARLRASDGDLEGAYALLPDALTATEQAIRGRAWHLRGQLAMDLEREAEAYESLGRSGRRARHRRPAGAGRFRPRRPRVRVSGDQPAGRAGRRGRGRAAGTGRDRRGR
ncbi:hypothetical protein [Fodinicola feengrottensis]|uniref:hypothetical protein n=1 Tax=Fodinicola feengrottensis TaxID=435914 RepID=UPI0024421314|nr:hypothetical protein [Fodinicola feengrottensis]